MSNYSDKIKFNHWIDSCPIDKPLVVEPVSQTTNDDDEWCYLIPVYVLVKQDEWDEEIKVE